MITLIVFFGAIIILTIGYILHMSLFLVSYSFKRIPFAVVRIKQHLTQSQREEIKREWGKSFLRNYPVVVCDIDTNIEFINDKKIFNSIKYEN